MRRALYIVFCAACCFGCTHSPTSPNRASREIDRLFIFVRGWPTGDVELILARDSGQSTVTLFHPAREGRPRIVLDSIGPVPQDTEEVRTMLDSFDVWALNAPNAPGAACRTTNGQRTCAIAFNDYSLVMRVEREGDVRVQRYTGLEKDTGNRTARALGDYVLAWAERLDARAQTRSLR